MGISYRIESVFPLADDVYVHASRSLDALLVERPRQGEISRVRRKGDRTVAFLQPELDVALQARIPDDAEDAEGRANREVLADEQVGRGRAVFQKTSCVSYYWKVKISVNLIDV